MYYEYNIGTTYRYKYKLLYHVFKIIELSFRIGIYLSKNDYNTLI